MEGSTTTSDDRPADRRDSAFHLLMKFVSEWVLVVFRPISPHLWPNSLDRLRSAEAWAPPMMLIATAGVIFSGRVLVDRLFVGLAVPVIHYATMATWLAVGSLASLSVMCDGANNLRRLGILGWTRPRWWFEIAREAWITFVFAALTLALLHFAGGRQFFAPTVIVFASLPFLFAAFMISTTCGYLLSIATWRRRSGRAFECVRYFFGVLALSLLAVALGISIPDQATLNLVYVVLGLVVISILSIIALKVLQRSRQTTG